MTNFKFVALALVFASLSPAALAANGDCSEEAEGIAEAISNGALRLKVSTLEKLRSGEATYAASGYYGGKDHAWEFTVNSQCLVIALKKTQ